jgi:hypothetical protein
MQPICFQPAYTRPARNVLVPPLPSVGRDPLGCGTVLPQQAGQGVGHGGEGVVLRALQLDAEGLEDFLNLLGAVPFPPRGEHLALRRARGQQVHLPGQPLGLLLSLPGQYIPGRQVEGHPGPRQPGHGRQAAHLNLGRLFLPRGLYLLLQILVQRAQDGGVPRRVLQLLSAQGPGPVGLLQVLG